MQFGIWLFEGLRAYGIDIRREQRTGNSEQRTDNSEQRVERQFPAQTLAYKAGTVTDAALLYGAALEAAGIRAGMIPLADGEVLGAFDLGINRDDAVTAALFNGPQKLLIIGEEVWLPVAVSKLNEGFTAAWAEGIRRADALLADEGGGAEMVIFEDAWAVYPPAPFPALNVRIGQADERVLSAGADGALQTYIQNEFRPKITAINTQIRNNPTASLYNQLGNLYLRSSMNTEAKAAYERAAGMGSVGAMVNRGNMALLEKDLAAAERWFAQALQREPGNAAALRGLRQIEK
jgi:tetratricopeptide (TPR) repeat protein